MIQEGINRLFSQALGGVVSYKGAKLAEAETERRKAEAAIKEQRAARAEQRAEEEHGAVMAEAQRKDYEFAKQRAQDEEKRKAKEQTVRGGRKGEVIHSPAGIDPEVVDVNQWRQEQINRRKAEATSRAEQAYIIKQVASGYRPEAIMGGLAMKANDKLSMKNTFENYLKSFQNNDDEGGNK